MDHRLGSGVTDMDQSVTFTDPGTNTVQRMTTTSPAMREVSDDLQRKLETLQAGGKLKGT